MTTYVPVPWPLFQKIVNLAFAYRELTRSLMYKEPANHEASIILADLENLPVPDDRIDMLPLMEYHITWKEDYFRRSLRNGFQQMFLARSRDQFSTLVANWSKTVLQASEVTVQLGPANDIMIDEGSTAIGKFIVEPPSFARNDRG